jgi:hypothetical protein
LYKAKYCHVWEESKVRIFLAGKNSWGPLTFLRRIGWVSTLKLWEHARGLVPL